MSSRSGFINLSAAAENRRIDDIQHDEFPGILEWVVILMSWAVLGETVRVHPSPAAEHRAHSHPDWGVGTPPNSRYISMYLLCTVRVSS